MACARHKADTSVEFTRFLCYGKQQSPGGTKSKLVSRDLARQASEAYVMAFTYVANT
jgi:hypothetical protein